MSDKNDKEEYNNWYFETMSKALHTAYHTYEPKTQNTTTSGDTSWVDDVIGGG